MRIGPFLLVLHCGLTLAAATTGAGECVGEPKAGAACAADADCWACHGNGAACTIDADCNGMVCADGDACTSSDDCGRCLNTGDVCDPDIEGHCDICENDPATVCFADPAFCNECSNGGNCNTGLDSECWVCFDDDSTPCTSNDDCDTGPCDTSSFCEANGCEISACQISACSARTCLNSAACNLDADGDGDGVGDACDVEDGLIWQWFDGPGRIEWQQELGFDAWNLYTGDLDVLRSKGLYSQLPGSNPLADRSCGLLVPGLDRAIPQQSGKTAFFLTTGVTAGVERAIWGRPAGVCGPTRIRAREKYPFAMPSRVTAGDQRFARM